MEYLIEALLDLILESSLEISTNNKVSKWIRYPLIILLALFFGIVIVGLFIFGFISLNENIYLGILLISISIVLLIGVIIKFRKLYLKKK